MVTMTDGAKRHDPTPKGFQPRPGSFQAVMEGTIDQRTPHASWPAAGGTVKEGDESMDTWEVQQQQVSMPSRKSKITVNCGIRIDPYEASLAMLGEGSDERIGLHARQSPTSRMSPASKTLTQRIQPKLLGTGFSSARSATVPEAPVVDGDPQCIPGALVKIAGEFENNPEWPQLRQFALKEGKLVRQEKGGWGWTANFGGQEYTFRTRDGIYHLAYMRTSSSRVASRRRFLGDDDSHGVDASQRAQVRMNVEDDSHSESSYSKGEVLKRPTFRDTLPSRPTPQVTPRPNATPGKDPPELSRNLTNPWSRPRVFLHELSSLGAPRDEWASPPSSPPKSARTAGGSVAQTVIQRPYFVGRTVANGNERNFVEHPLGKTQVYVGSPNVTRKKLPEDDLLEALHEPDPAAKTTFLSVVGVPNGVRVPVLDLAGGLEGRLPWRPVMSLTNRSNHTDESERYDEMMTAKWASKGAQWTLRPSTSRQIGTAISSNRSTTRTDLSGGVRFVGDGAPNGSMTERPSTASFFMSTNVAGTSAVRLVKARERYVVDGEPECKVGAAVKVASSCDWPEVARFKGRKGILHKKPDASGWQVFFPDLRNISYFFTHPNCRMLVYAPVSGSMPKPHLYEYLDHYIKNQGPLGRASSVAWNRGDFPPAH